ncbi:(2,3-dihydroxybenzoyl)adenylate synthase [Pseudochelatococcus contaminans]|uniref:3-methylmercaptopropionyl-CoA ligase n=1 Tax=Pseudochelatococcus contaminans TaxID=1538103 RepID=A0A7W6EE77_9HYPH|nr:2,3-dihydroxybenzoate-AMP ligase [Pseudochelatococcus contaminans]
MIPAIQQWPSAFAERYRAAGYWRGETFGGILRQRAEHRPDHTAIVEGNTRWTYADLDARVDALARGFTALGLRRGERVIVQLPNVAPFFSVVFGLFRAGILPVFALPAHRVTEIVHFANRSQARAYVILDTWDGFDYRALAAEVKEKAPTLEHVIVAGDDAGPFTPLADIEKHEGPLPPEPASSDVAFLQISGGSTGLSKLIPRTHDDYIYSLRGSNDICELDENGVYLGALPIAHNFPMSSPGTFGALYAGATVVLSPSPSPDAVFPLIEREKVTITGVVPPVALIWADAARSGGHDLSSLKLLQVGGAKLTPEVARRLLDAFGPVLQQVFGMAEGLVNYTRPDDDEEVVIHTQGRPISPDDELLILDDDGNPVPPGTPGHLLTRGPYTIRQYFNEPEANAASFTPDGFYRTGDIVLVRPDGNLVVQGRAKDQINRGGEKVSAEEIEDHLLAHPQVFDAAVVSIPDEYLGERTCAFIIARSPAPKGVELKKWVRDRGLAAFKVPDRVVFVDSFHTTAVGKVSRKDLRATLRQRLLDADAAERKGE